MNERNEEEEKKYQQQQFVRVAHQIHKQFLFIYRLYVIYLKLETRLWAQDY